MDGTEVKTGPSARVRPWKAPGPSLLLRPDGSGLFVATPDDPSQTAGPPMSDVDLPTLSARHPGSGWV